LDKFINDFKIGVTGFFVLVFALPVLGTMGKAEANKVIEAFLDYGRALKDGYLKRRI